MGKQIKIHYISDDKKRSFIVASTSCGVHWSKCKDFTSIKKYVTCIKCINNLNKTKIKTLCKI